MRNRMLLTVLLGSLFASSTLSAQIRTWTDNAGRQVKAKFGGVNGDNVVLVQGLKRVVVPLNSLSDADRAYIAAKQGGDAGQEPDAEDDQPNAQVKQLGKMERDRTWHDSRGKTIKAKFVRVHDGNVILKQGVRIQKIPFDKFAANDQETIKQLLQEDGLDDVVASLESSASGAQDPFSGNTTNPSSPLADRPIRSNRQNGVPGVDAAFNNAMAQAERQQRDMMERMNRHHQDAAETAREIESSFQKSEDEIH